ncbi:dinitrogenase iron-molybdenum cofactor biosynthesis protein [Methanosarcina sp. 2.H.T.1A.6]|uniref:NifB/NifX family molybdenum-iron cluster-binding protein n=1 Tax=unclassified Methanosarcina TaxID=2644672 RepID=UPI000622501B|nr:MULTISPECIES: NifB/NifX family molybdenum-iron cluster-binding protein [unclassified Methanosarcina]KKG18105.1 dinitrogenase iron-molybdenum cofactor biosynthesis protein [Methanosarcina sp. 2.H.T.1A.3]KKG20054.1 dinitrogenase iron-molybdenum cofactor biosynthesis protein [Methanosarcina sp. 2.H.T.1A.6]KKG22718.1 dinitrogenase iron-molybdenum cofactor biosynthesis protein [Methanosarcina sp. 2.H.T.1A.8]KKG25501.1 dinitrogenase iron-molybdenum cofactor biosynthesis protein [Methanosarcina sp.
MKVCVPTRDNNGMEGTIEQHFGKAPTYTILDTDSGEVSVIPNTSEHMGGVGLPPEFLYKNGVNIMLCSGLGYKAVKMFESYGINVFVGVEGTVQDAIEAWKAGQLRSASAENTCAEHEHHH